MYTHVITAINLILASIFSFSIYLFVNIFTIISRPY